MEQPGPLPTTDIHQAGEHRERRAAGGQPPLGALLFPDVLRRLLNLYTTLSGERLFKLTTLNGRFLYEL